MKIKDKMWKGEGGFTLVELLVVVAILAVLVAVVMASFTGLLSGSKATANSAELNIMQTAVDVKMANTSMSTWVPVILVGAATDDMTNAAGGFNLYPTYMRSSTSNCNYTVDENNGTVSQISCP